jgi:hypothetical protein
MLEGVRSRLVEHGRVQPEIWLRANTRAVLFGMVPPALLVAMGLALAGAFVPVTSTAAKAVGYVLTGIAGAALGMLIWELRRPRLAYVNRQLLVYLRAGPPFRVPIEAVEGFLLGQGPSMLAGRHRQQEAATLVVRLAERAEEWAFRDVKPALGSWCGGYVTIRGTWCEPLSLPLVNRLNARLAEVQREQRQGVEA